MLHRIEHWYMSHQKIIVFIHLKGSHIIVKTIILIWNTKIIFNSNSKHSDKFKKIIHKWSIFLQNKIKKYEHAQWVFILLESVYTPRGGTKKSALKGYFPAVGSFN